MRLVIGHLSVRLGVAGVLALLLAGIFGEWDRLEAQNGNVRDDGGVRAAREAEVALGAALGRARAVLYPEGFAALMEAQLAWEAFVEKDWALFRRYSKTSAEEAAGYREDALKRRVTQVERATRDPRSSRPFFDKSLTAAAADARLNQTYKHCLALMTAAQRNQMIEVQRQWILWRQRHIDFESAFWNGLHARATIEADFTLQRVRELWRHSEALLAMKLGNQTASVDDERDDPLKLEPSEHDPDIFRFAR